jgi:hypothetical protein
VTAVLATGCAGLWRRTLLIEADGSRDTGEGVMWLQGVTAYVDSRGFAGVLHQRGDVFAWQRDIDLQPPGRFPDEGVMHWDGNILVESGVHEDYVEHWVRDDSTSAPCGALFLVGPGGDPGLFVRAGATFGWASAGAVFIGSVDGARLQPPEIVISETHVHANGVPWAIDSSEGNVNP